MPGVGAYAFVDGVRGLLLVVLALAGVFATAVPAGAQTRIDRRQAVLPAPTTIELDRCTVIGDGSRGRAEGLHLVSGGVRSASGATLLLNAGTAELLAFKADGSFDGSRSSLGEGPGELSATPSGYMPVVVAVPYRGDSLAVYDGQRRRLSVFGTNGNFGRSFQVDLDANLARNARIIGATDDPDFVLVASGLVSPAMPSAGRVVGHDSVVVVRLSASGQAVWISPPIEDAGYEILVEPAPRASTATTGSYSLRSRPGSRPVVRHGSSAVSGNLVFHYAERTNELEGFDRNGNRVVTIRLPPLPTPLPQVPGTSIASQGLGMASDDQGRLWLEVPRIRRDTTRDWWIITPQGALAGLVHTPARSAPLSITRHGLVLLAYDENNVETVRICPLPDLK